MKPTRLFPILIVIACLFWTAAAFGQDAPRPEGDGPARKRPNLFAALGLTPEQVDQIKQINLERRPQLQQAAQRLREANRALDAAVYSDVLDENAVRLRLRDFQGAQAQMAGLRFATELAVRKVLTPEQLVKFRTLRQQFAARRAREQLKRRSMDPGFRSPKDGTPPPQDPN